MDLVCNKSEFVVDMIVVMIVVIIRLVIVFGSNFLVILKMVIFGLLIFGMMRIVNILIKYGVGTKNRF